MPRGKTIMERQKMCRLSYWYHIWAKRSTMLCLPWRIYCWSSNSYLQSKSMISLSSKLYLYFFDNLVKLSICKKNFEKIYVILASKWSVIEDYQKTLYMNVFEKITVQSALISMYIHFLLNKNDKVEKPTHGSKSLIYFI